MQIEKECEKRFLENYTTIFNLLKHQIFIRLIYFIWNVSNKDINI